MNEKVFNALMHLFALVSAIDGISDKSKAQGIVIHFLKTYLNTELTEKYLLQFNTHLENLTSSGSQSVEGRKKKVSGGSVKVLRICGEIASELDQQQKLFVLIRLMEFLDSRNSESQNSSDFVDTVAVSFKFERGEFALLRRFMESEFDSVDEEFLLTISSESESSKGLTIARQVDGKAYVLHIKSSNNFLLKYAGADSLRLNSAEVHPDRAYTIGPGSILYFPKAGPIYYANIQKAFVGDSSDGQIRFTGKDVEFHFKNSENGIQKFSFHEESGHLVGIMGGSGVGKSTLVNVLNGNIEPDKGSITINGLDLSSSEKLKGIVGYVPQDDLLFEDLTVFDNLYYNAKLCFADLNEDELTSLVDKTLLELELNEIGGLKVGSPTKKVISGGQRKRLNIALELIREPGILIIDEPTSGLSSMDSEMIMGILKELTVHGKLVIVNIHQPSASIYNLLDRLIILDKGGHPIYYGNPIEALSYFKAASGSLMSDRACVECGNIEVHKPLEIIESKILDEQGRATKTRKVSPKEWYERYVNEIDSKLKIPEPDDSLPPPINRLNLLGAVGQLFVFFQRNVKSKIANGQFLVINLLVSPLLACLLSFLIKYSGNSSTEYLLSDNENIPAYLFMIVIVGLFLGMTMSAEEIIRDRKILQRESFLKLSWASYIHSKVLTLAGFALIQAASFILVGNAILEIQELFWVSFFIMFSTILASTLIGLNLSAMFDSAVAVYVTIPLILVPQLLLSGVIVDYYKINDSLVEEKYTPVVGDLMISRWAYEALAINMFKNNRYEQEFFWVDQKISNSSFKISFTIEKLGTKLNSLIGNASQEVKYQNLLVLKSEFEKLAKESGLVYSGPWISESDTGGVRESFIEASSAYLKSLSSHFKQINAKYISQKREITSNLSKEFGSPKRLAEMRRLNHNDQLEEMVRRRNLKDQIITTKDNELFQIRDAVFCRPTNNCGRAHFYASEKLFFGHYIDSVWFNVVVIWLFTTSLYLLLLARIPSKLMGYLMSLKKFA